MEMHAGGGGEPGTNFHARLAWAVLTGPGPCQACCCEAEVGEEPISVVRRLAGPSSSHYRFFSVLNNSRKACLVSSRSFGSLGLDYREHWEAGGVGWLHTILRSPGCV